MNARRWVFALATVLALAFAYDLWRIPVQVSDSLGDLLEVQSAPSLGSAFASGLEVPGFLRPIKAAQTRIVSDLSRGAYTTAFRGVHVVLLVLTVWMFVLVLQVRDATDVAAAVFALTVLLGAHTFANVLGEAYPINHFLEIMLLALVALRLAQRPPGSANDVAAVAVFGVAAFTVESGLLIWVVLVAARLAGLRGVSMRGLAGATLVLGGYAYQRVVVLSTGLPTVDERSSAMWLRVLEPPELLEQFAANPLPFYAYNVGASFFSVLFAEPRAGLWVTTAAFRQGDVWPWMVVGVVSSALTTMCIVAAVVSSWRDRTGRSEADRLYFVAASVLAGNAVLTFGYLKDDLMSLAGAFYALAAYAAVRRLIRRGALMKPAAVAVLAVVVVVASTGWAVRTAGLHYSLRYTAFKTRNDWTAVNQRWFQGPEWRVVTERLRTDAFARRGVAPRFFPTWEERWFEE